MFAITILLTATFVSGSNEPLPGDEPETIFSATDAIDGLLATSTADLTEGVASVVGAAAQVADTTASTSIDDDIPIRPIVDYDVRSNPARFRAAGKRVKDDNIVAKIVGSAVEQGAIANRIRRERELAVTRARVEQTEARIRMRLTQVRDVLVSSVPSRQNIHDMYQQIDMLAEFLAARANDAVEAARPTYNPQRREYYHRLLDRLAQIGGGSLIAVVSVASYSLGPQMARLFIRVVVGLLGYIPGAAPLGVVASYMPTIMTILFTLMCLRHAFFPSDIPAAIEE